MPRPRLAQRLEEGRGRGLVLACAFTCLARLQRAFDAAHATPDPRPGTTVAVPGIVEQLTSRELEVLEMAAAGRSNQAIGRPVREP